MRLVLLVFFFNDTATTEIYTLSLHDALPIFLQRLAGRGARPPRRQRLRLFHVGGVFALRAVDDRVLAGGGDHLDRKSTRLNSSHANISYAVFCLKQKQNADLVLSASARMHPP